MATIKIDMTSVMRKIRNIERLLDGVEKIANDEQKEIYDAARKYPPPPPRSRYIRTMKLRDSWRKPPVVRTSNRVTAVVKTDGSAKTRYGRYDIYVMLAKRQALVHQGRWHTERSMADDAMPRYSKKIQALIKREVNR